MVKSICIGNLSPVNFEEIVNHILNFELDNRNLMAEQFLVARQEDQTVGFGRIREYAHCSELCSLGVIEPERNKGIGSLLVKSLIQKTTLPLYLVCIIPDFFKPFGFIETNDYPLELQHKLDYCTSELVVPETYVVMKYSPSL